MIDLSYYINSDKIVTATAHESEFPGAGNGLLSTGVAWATGSYDPDIGAIIASCKTPENSPLVFRSPHKKNKDDHQTADDYWGVLPMSGDWSRDILDYAESHDWDFDIQGQANPKFRFDRFMDFPPFLRLCAGKDISLWDHAVLVGSMILRSYSISDADGNKKSFCFGKRVQSLSPFGYLAFKLWKKRIKAKYGIIGMSWAQSMPGHPLNNYDEE